MNKYFGIKEKDWEEYVKRDQEITREIARVYKSQLNSVYGKCLNEKIVITHDGKTTTATKYCGDGSKVTATAKCAPEDEFNFEVGAKLALERLTEKVAPADEWVVVKRKPRVGDYIRLKTDGMYRWNKPGDILRVDEIGVGTGTLVKVYGKNHVRPTDDRDFLWSYSHEEYEIVEKATKDETPKYYNGKVVCVSNKGAFDSGFTVGKIYEVVDGKFIDNNHESRPLTEDRITDLGDLNNEYFKHWGFQFIPLVE